MIVSKHNSFAQLYNFFFTISYACGSKNINFSNQQKLLICYFDRENLHKLHKYRKWKDPIFYMNIQSIDLKFTKEQIYNKRYQSSQTQFIQKYTYKLLLYQLKIPLYQQNHTLKVQNASQMPIKYLYYDPNLKIQSIFRLRAL
ncbi:Hypothetical_protein [Hexamita inflata]|uniref:Hypothetical_protein n=1 Tax=Hexamita inflata TaxID=28002 RepID=A0ABP1I7I5_9EUKA